MSRAGRAKLQAITRKHVVACLRIPRGIRRVVELSLRRFSRELVSSITSDQQASLLDGSIPEAWREAEVKRLWETSPAGVPLELPEPAGDRRIGKDRRTDRGFDVFRGERKELVKRKARGLSEKCEEPLPSLQRKVAWRMWSLLSAHEQEDFKARAAEATFRSRNSWGRFESASAPVVQDSDPLTALLQGPGYDTPKKTKGVGGEDTPCKGWRKHDFESLGRSFVQQVKKFEGEAGGNMKMVARGSCHSVRSFVTEVARSITEPKRKKLGRVLIQKRLQEGVSPVLQDLDRRGRKASVSDEALIEGTYTHDDVNDVRS